MAHEATVGISIEFGLWIIWIIWQAIDAIESTSLVGRPLVYLSDATAMKRMNGDEWRQITKDLNTLMPLWGMDICLPAMLMFTWRSPATEVSDNIWLVVNGCHEF